MSTPTAQYRELGGLMMQDSYHKEPAASYGDVQGVQGYENGDSMPRKGTVLCKQAFAKALISIILLWACAWRSISSHRQRVCRWARRHAQMLMTAPVHFMLVADPSHTAPVQMRA